jgi:hypothetical protein
MTGQNDDDPEYKVGYGKPPLKDQFRKGVSGNPRGRPPKIEPSRSERQQQIEFLEVAEEPITVMVNGKRKRISGLQAVALKLRQKALGGDFRSIMLFVALSKESGGAFSAANPELTSMIDSFHKGRVLQLDPLDAEAIKYLNKIHKKTRGR